MLQQFLSAADAERASRTLSKLARHNLSRWALAGGFAVEIYCLRGGAPASLRRLNDIDFVAPGFECVPETLAGEFLFRHVHPSDPPGKTLLQCVDADTSLRVDLFRGYGVMMSRTLAAGLPSGAFPLISLEDVVARTARLLMDLDAGVPVPAKHAADYLRLAELVQPSSVEAAWQDHRKPPHPATFRETNTLLMRLIAARRHLLMVPEYSKDTAQVCQRCVPSAPFQLADAKVVLSLLGYC